PIVLTFGDGNKETYDKKFLNLCEWLPKELNISKNDFDFLGEYSKKDFNTCYNLLKDYNDYCENQKPDLQFTIKNPPENAGAIFHLADYLCAPEKMLRALALLAHGDTTHYHRLGQDSYKTECETLCLNLPGIATDNVEMPFN